MLKDEVRQMLELTGANPKAVLALAEKRGYNRDEVKATMKEINSEDPAFIENLRNPVQQDRTATADPVLERKLQAKKDGARVAAQQEYGVLHKQLPAFTEALVSKSGIGPAVGGLADDVTSWLGRAPVAFAGKGLEGWGDMLDIDYLRRLPSTDMDNPEGIGHDNSAIFTMVGAPLKFGIKAGAKVLPGLAKKVAAGTATKAEKAALKAATKAGEYGTDFGASWLMNSALGNDEIGAAESAAGTGVGMGIDLLGAGLKRTPMGKLLTPFSLPGVKRAEDVVHDLGKKAEDKGVNTASAWMRPTKSQDMKAGGLDARTLLEDAPDGSKSAIQPGATQMDVKDKIDETVQKMHEQRGKLWQQVDKQFEDGGPIYTVKADGSQPMPVNMDDVGQEYVDLVTKDVGNGKLFSVEAQNRADKFWADRAQDAEDYATGTGIFGNEQPHWRARVKNEDGSFTYFRDPKDVPMGVPAEYGLYVSPHQLQKQSQDVYDKYVRNANARAKKMEGITPTDISANRAYDAMSQAIAGTTDDFGASAVPGYFATRKNYAKWLPWMHAAADKSREWTTDFFGNLSKKQEPLRRRVTNYVAEHTLPMLRNGVTPGKARQLYDVGKKLQQFTVPASPFGMGARAASEVGTRGQFGVSGVQPMSMDELNQLLYEEYGILPPQE
jgi:hypothetical protein